MIVLLIGLVLVLIITSSVSICLRESYKNKTATTNSLNYNEIAAASIGMTGTFTSNSGTSISQNL